MSVIEFLYCIKEFDKTLSQETPFITKKWADSGREDCIVCDPILALTNSFVNHHAL